jgi:hypothetical protein
MNAVGFLSAEGEFSAVLIRADGSHREVAREIKKHDIRDLSKKLLKPLGFWRRVYAELRSKRTIPAALTFAAFLHAIHSGDTNGIGLALVTTAGINILAADFVSGASLRINAFNYHDSGTGTTAAAIGDTALVTQAGPATRATGTQSTPSAGQYRSIGTIAYVSTLAITEWGLFSQAAQGGTLWDRRTFAALNVVSGDSLAVTYTLTCNAGGS